MHLDKKNLPEFLQIIHNQNTDIILQELFITISVTFLVSNSWIYTPFDTNISFLKHCSPVCKRVFNSQPNQRPTFHQSNVFLYKQLLTDYISKSLGEIVSILRY